MEFTQYNPILYLEEYEDVPEDIYRWKQDEELRPWWGWNHPGLLYMSLDKIEAEMPECSGCDLRKCHVSGVGMDQIRRPVPARLCVGIGRYHTEMDGDIYLCVLLDMDSKTVVSCSLGVYRSPELVRKALEIFFQSMPFSNIEDEAEKEIKQIIQPKKITLLCSRNLIYQKKAYWDIVAKFPVEPIMTAKGTRGGASAVSTYFSQLMRRKGGTVFYTWQDAVDWLSEDITWYNQKQERSI